jgi:hypothetical protein
MALSLTYASASKWDPTFAGIKFLNGMVNLRNWGVPDWRPSGPLVGPAMRKKINTLTAIEVVSHFEALQHLERITPDEAPPLLTRGGRMQTNIDILHWFA